MLRRERFLKAAELEEPDMVPVSDLNMDPPVVQDITGIKTGGYSVMAPGLGESGDIWKIALNNTLATVDAYNKMGFDAVFLCTYSMLNRDYKPTKVGPDTYIDPWGRLMMVNPRAKTTTYAGGTLNTLEEMENYTPPDPHAKGRQEIIETAVKKARAETDMAVCVSTLDGFSLSWQLRGGIQKWIIDIFRNPTVAKRYREKIADFFLEVNKIIIDAGVDLIAPADDYSGNKGPFLNPALMREFEFPYLKRLCDFAKKRGVLVLKHADGNNYPILEDLISTGIDGLHPLEPGVMEIGDVKKRYKDKLFVMGNVDIKYALSSGSEEDVRREVRRCIDAASWGGGHILSSSACLETGVKVENILTMVDEARKYGKYPLHKR